MASIRRRSRNENSEETGRDIAKVSFALPEPLKTRLKSSFMSKINEILKAYVKFSSSPYNQDRVLKVAQYALWLISRFYIKSTRNALEKLSDEVMWARYINRFFGLPSAIEAAQTGDYGSPKALGKAMAWMFIGYYPCEHLAFLKWKVPDFCFRDPRHSRLAALSSAWSCRFWLGYIILDVFRSTLYLNSTEENEKTRTKSEKLQLVRNALFALPAITWSLPNWDTHPLLSRMVCNNLMLSEALVCLYQALGC